VSAKLTPVPTMATSFPATTDSLSLLIASAEGLERGFLAIGAPIGDSKHHEQILELTRNSGEL
jgi:hypothetical protein